jgi:hypothetical protein
MKKMKIKIISSTLIAGALLITSCQKKVLDLVSFNSPSDVSAFANPDAVQLSMYGVYDASQSGFYAGGAVRGYPFGAANIEQSDMRGEDMLNQATFYQITYEATYNNASPNNGFMFETIYSMVNKANLVIEGVRGAGAGGIITTTAALQYEAECRFLRAMGHHELVLNFSRPYADGAGNQPGIIYRDFAIKDQATVAAASAIQRSSFTVANNYTQILDDLNFAETNLPATPIVNTLGVAIKTFRATRAAAIALKMRVKMHMGDWAGVITEGNKLVPAAAPYISTIGGWRLNAAPDGAFSSNTSDENIFSIKNDATDNPNVNGALPQMFGDPALGARGLVRVSPIIWSDPDWKCNDLRRSTLYRTSGSPVNAVYTIKYRDYATSSDAAPQIRYAEVLLTLAEAEARNAAGTTVSVRGLDLLNAVRNRSVTTPADQFTLASFANKNALIAAILKERRIEFLAEGKRWGDIHRLALDAVFAPVSGGGIPSKVGSGGATAAMFNCLGVAFTRSVPAIAYSDFRFLWPIPLSETQQNANYSQNPGY